MKCGTSLGDMPEDRRAAHTEDKVAELTADLRVQADFANYRKAGVARSARRPLTSVVSNCWVYWTISAGAQARHLIEVH